MKKEFENFKLSLKFNLCIESRVKNLQELIKLINTLSVSKDGNFDSSFLERVDNELMYLNNALEDIAEILANKRTDEK